ncbi:MAG TPA: hypothetical protein PLY66_15710 [Acidobacteriota bacterium]|nr:hypothetical protein [Acidobacteriota bacterium]
MLHQRRQLIQRPASALLGDALPGDAIQAEALRWDGERLVETG